MIELLKLADELDNAGRLGRENDIPEGTRYIVMSDTCAKKISKGLREYVECITKGIQGSVECLTGREDEEEFPFEPTTLDPVVEESLYDSQSITGLKIMNKTDYYYKRSLRKNHGGKIVQKVCQSCGHQWEGYPNERCPHCGHYRGKGK